MVVEDVEPTVPVTKPDEDVDIKAVLDVVGVEVKVDTVVTGSDVEVDVKRDAVVVEEGFDVTHEGRTTSTYPYPVAITALEHVPLVTFACR